MASREFSLLGVPVVDTDTIAHQLTAVNSPVLNKIVAAFGADFLNENGSLNRAKLRTHVFKDDTQRIKLESIMHPAIYITALSELEENQTRLNPPYQLVVVPLLFGSKRFQSLANISLLIDCDEALQIARAMSRSQLTEEEVKAFMAAQTSRTNRLLLADEVIENNGTIKELQEKIRQIHKKFINTCIVSK